jgi:hypothetical protein
LDLVISDNSQLGGHGKFKSYIFNAPPSGQSSPYWLSASGGFGSAVLMEDLNLDDQVDLLTGRWWGSIDFYPGTNGSFTLNPTWNSNTGSVVEAYFLKDVDQDSQIPVIDTVIVDRDSIHVVYIPQNAVEKVNSLKLNGVFLTPAFDYNYTAEMKWVSFRQTLVSADEIIFVYETSTDRDLLVSNWDSSIGNYLFYNQTFVNSVKNKTAQIPEIKVISAPNPFNNSCTIKIYNPERNNIMINIFDVRGKFIKNLANQQISAGQHQFIWDSIDMNGKRVASGHYFYTVQIGEFKQTGKLLLLK